MEDFNPATFDWNKPHTIGIINGKYMDYNTVGKSIQNPQYAFARNASLHGYATCEICGARYTLNASMTANSAHVKTAKHQAALKNKPTPKQHLYW